MCTQSKGNTSLSALLNFQQILFKDELSCYSSIRMLMIKKQQMWEFKVFEQGLFLHVSTADSVSVTYIHPCVGIEIFSDISHHISIFLRHEHRYFVITKNMFICQA